MDYEKLIKYSIENLETFDKRDLALLFKWYNAKTIQELAGAILIRYQRGSMNPAKVWQVYKSSLLEKINSDNTYTGILDNIDSQFLEADPSKNKKYLEWIIKSYIDNGIKDFSELKSINKALTNYEILLNKDLIKDNWFKDINHFCGIHGCLGKKKVKIGLNEFLKGFSKELTEIIEQKEGEKDVTRVYEDSDILIVSPKTHSASCKYGANTKWCTTEKDDPTKFIEYTEKGPLYIIIPKNPIRDNEKYQLHFKNDEFMDEMNDSISLKDLSERFPNLLEIDELKNEFLAFFVKLLRNYIKDDEIYINHVYDKASYYLKKGADPNKFIYINGIKTPIIFIAKVTKIIQLFLDYGANVNSTDEYGNNFLLEILKFEDVNLNVRLNIIKLLIKAGADPNIQNNYGETALMIANYDDNLDIVNILLKAGADPNIKDKNGVTALMNATYNPDIVEIMIKAGADPNIQDIYGKTALMNPSGRKNIVEILIKAGADPNIQNNNGETALMIANHYDNPDIVEILIKSGADPNIQDKNGKTALMNANRKNIVEILINAGANPNIKDTYGKTALMNAIINGRKDIVEILINADAEPNIKDISGILH